MLMPYSVGEALLVGRPSSSCESSPALASRLWCHEKSLAPTILLVSTPSLRPIRKAFSYNFILQGKNVALVQMLLRRSKSHHCLPCFLQWFSCRGTGFGNGLRCCPKFCALGLSERTLRPPKLEVSPEILTRAIMSGSFYIISQYVNYHFLERFMHSPRNLSPYDQGTERQELSVRPVVIAPILFTRIGRSRNTRIRRVRMEGKFVLAAGQIPSRHFH